MVIAPVTLLSLFAGQPTPLLATASIQEERLLQGEIAQVEVRVLTTVNGPVELEYPDVEGLVEVKRAQQVKTEMIETDGGRRLKRDQRILVDFFVEKAGVHRVGPFKIKVDDIAVETGRVRFEALGRDDAVALVGTASAGVVLGPRPGEQKIFVRYRVDKSRVVEGEQILVDLELFAKKSFRIKELNPPPAFEGFWSEVVFQAKKLVPRTERVAGRQYRVYRLWRVALFGLKPQETILPVVDLDLTLDGSIATEGKLTRRSTPHTKISVLELPAKGRSKDFVASNVGKYALTASVDRTSAKVGEPVAFALELSGRGNIRRAVLPVLPTLADFRAYQPTTKTNAKLELEGVFGKKRTEILLLPRKAGRLEIPQLSMVVFDPESKSYVPLTTESIRIAVTGSGTPTDDEAQLDLALAKDERGSALRPLRFRSELVDRRPSSNGRRTFYGLLALPAILFAFLWLEPAARALLFAETPKKLMKRTVAKERARLNALLTGKTIEPAALSDLVLDVAANAAGQNVRGLTRAELTSALAEGGASDALIKDVIDLLDSCDRARFAKSAGADRSLLAKTESCVERMFEILRTGGAR